MRQLELFVDQRSLFDKLCDPAYLKEGFKAVKRNGGSAGTDGVTVKVFACGLSGKLGELSRSLKDWTYQPSPVRRVEIPKPGKGSGVRLLGVPCIKDRVVQATLKILLEPLIDPSFSDNSYGFRPGRSQRHAVEAAQQIVNTGKEYVVDIDMSKFFDRVNHDRLIHGLSQFVSDKRILRIVGMTLRSGVIKDGVFYTSPEGTVQGSPLSPLLSTIVLDELEKELERRGLSFCRYADDCNIFLGSQKAAQRVMQSIGEFIENKLKLVINREKSKVALSRFVKFLGMTIIAGKLVISSGSMERAMAKVKELTPRGTSLPLEKTVERINDWYMGWSGYYLITQDRSQLGKIEAHIRRRLRSRIIGEQKRKRHLCRKLVKRGVSKSLAARTVYSNKGRWALSHTPAIERAYPNRWFIEQMGLKIRSGEKHPHWSSSGRQIRTT